MESWSSPETAERVLVHLEQVANKAREVRCSARSTGRDVGISYTTANRALARLVASGALEVVRTGSSSRYPTVYRVARPADPELANRYMPVA